MPSRVAAVPLVQVLYAAVYGREELVHGLVNASSAGVPYTLRVAIGNTGDRSGDRSGDRRNSALRGTARRPATRVIPPRMEVQVHKRTSPILPRR